MLKSPDVKPGSPSPECIVPGETINGKIYLCPFRVAGEPAELGIGPLHRCSNAFKPHVTGCPKGLEPQKIGKTAELLVD